MLTPTPVVLLPLHPRAQGQGDPSTVFTHMQQPKGLADAQLVPQAANGAGTRHGLSGTS